VGQNWWWVVLAVLVIALLVALTLLRSRARRAESSPRSDVEVAAAAAGGAAGAVGAAAIAVTHAEHRPDAVSTAEPAAGDRANAGSDATEPDETAPEREDGGVVPTAGRAAGAEARLATDPSAAIGAGGAADAAAAAAAADSGGAADLGADRPGVVAGTGGVSAAERDDGDPEPTVVGSAGDEVPAPEGTHPPGQDPGDRKEPAAPDRSAGPRAPDAAGSALAALDSDLVGPAPSFAAAAAAVSAAAARPGPYPGSLLPAADGSSPGPDHLVKANEGSRRYHTPESPYYVRTRGDAWFRTAEEARAAGFTPWNAAR
jgi:hypothetical protein